MVFFDAVDRRTTRRRRKGSRQERPGGEKESLGENRNGAKDTQRKLPPPDDEQHGSGIPWLDAAEGVRVAL